MKLEDLCLNNLQKKNSAKRFHKQPKMLTYVVKKFKSILKVCQFISQVGNHKGNSLDDPAQPVAHSVEHLHLNIGFLSPLGPPDEYSF